MLRSGRKDNFHAEGVAILLGKRVQKLLIGWEPISHRILRVSFSISNKRVEMNIVVIYVPTNRAEEQDTLDFYNELQDLLEKRLEEM